MNPGNPTSVDGDELLSLDPRAPSDPAEYPTHEDEFHLQQQKIERLNQYYDEVVAELRALLAQDCDEGG
jgi:hypothetical protein